MEPSGKKGIFVGYSETSKAYRIYILGTRLIEVSKDVTFQEETTFRRPQEIQDDTKMEEPKSPSDKDERPESSTPSIQREE